MLEELVLIETIHDRKKSHGLYFNVHSFSSIRNTFISNTRSILKIILRTGLWDLCKMIVPIPNSILNTFLSGRAFVKQHLSQGQNFAMFIKKARKEIPEPGNSFAPAMLNWKLLVLTKKAFKSRNIITLVYLWLMINIRIMKQPNMETWKFGCWNTWAQYGFVVCKNNIFFWYISLKSILILHNWGSNIQPWVFARSQHQQQKTIKKPNYCSTIAYLWGRESFRKTLGESFFIKSKFPLKFPLRRWQENILPQSSGIRIQSQIWKPIRSSKSLRIHPIYWCGGILGSLLLRSGQKLYYCLFQWRGEA